MAMESVEWMKLSVFSVSVSLALLVTIVRLKLATVLGLTAMAMESVPLASVDFFVSAKVKY